MKKRILACIVCLCVVLSIAPTIVFAEDKEERVTSINDNGFSVFSDKEFINRTSSTEGNVVVIDQAGTFYVTGSTEDYRIEIRITDETKAGTVTIFLQGATIKPSTPGAAIGVAKECAEETKVTIMLSEGSVNEVSGYRNSGINNLGRELKIVGNGTLKATGGDYAAGIGGGCGDDGSNITISDLAKVEAIGGKRAAGIGGGKKFVPHSRSIPISGGSGTNITISDHAIVEAFGNEYAAGIGGGSNGNGTNIVISDYAKVHAKGGDCGAGIGGGSFSCYSSDAHGRNIVISDYATVNAEGGANAAGIGGGGQGDGSNITISDHATVNATGCWGGAGIGGAMRGNGSNITISDHATVNAIGGSFGAGIGGGEKGNGLNITISGNARVYARSGENAAGIGGGMRGNGLNITISGDPTIQVTTSSVNEFGFGNGFGAIGESKITISGGTIKTLNCIPFSDRPDLSHYNCDIYLNSGILDYEILNEILNYEIFEDRSDDPFTSYADRFEIIPEGSRSCSFFILHILFEKSTFYVISFF